MLKKSLIIIGIISLCVVPFYNTGDTHSGRTDKYGGHNVWVNGKKVGYHYHNKGTVRPPTPYHNKGTVRPPTPKPILTGNEGNERYIPTKLEWLALNLNSKYRLDAIATKGLELAMSFRAMGNNTIGVDMFYTPSTPASERTHFCDEGKEAVQTVAK